MNRLNALVIALFLGVAGVTGAMAITKTMRLGAASATPAKTDRAVVRARAKRLDTWAKALRTSLAKRPPALPRVPRYAPVAIASYAPAAVPTAAPAAAPTRTTAAERVVRRDVKPIRASASTTRPRDGEQPKPETPTTTATSTASTTTAPPAAAQPQSPPSTTEPSGGGGDDGAAGSDDPPGDR